MVKKFEFWRHRFKGAPILEPQNFVKFYLFFIFAYPENFMYLVCVVKKIELWRPRLKGTPTLEPPLFVRFSLFYNLPIPKI